LQIEIEMISSPTRCITPPRDAYSLTGNSNHGSPRRFSNSPSARVPTVISDRFIPSRISSNFDDALDNFENISMARMQDEESKSTFDNQNQNARNSLLRSELVGSVLNDSTTRGDLGTSANSNFLKFSSPKKRQFGSSSFSSSSNDVLQSGKYSQHNLLQSPDRSLSIMRKTSRKIAKVPYKVLDAPKLADDFYMNLVDWSAKNIVAVALESSIFLWYILYKYQYFYFYFFC
jgi:cell division cycle 20-like protein 1 (cofactor of APC complex)